MTIRSATTHDCVQNNKIQDSASNIGHNQYNLSDCLAKFFCCCFRKSKKTAKDLPPPPSSTNSDSPPHLFKKNFHQNLLKSSSRGSDNYDSRIFLSYWRQNMIKDTVLPSIAICELIIEEQRYQELFILKRLFNKCENKHKWADLKPESQDILDKIDDQKTSPILAIINQRSSTTR